MTNEEARMTKPIKTYDLEARTSELGEHAIELCQRIRETAVTRPLIDQFVRSSTSIGANYCEADDAESTRDFRHKIALCRKESRETKFWCRMLAKAVPDEKIAIRVLWKEANELNLIFSTIFRKTKVE